MVGLNLLAVGAVVEPKSGDTSANAVSPSEGTEFAGVLEAMLPADALPASEESASPNADALGAQIATLGLPLLTLLPVQTPAVADRAVEPSLQPAPSADAPTLYAPTTLRGYAPEPAPALGAGMGDGDFTYTLTEASENLLAVEGDAPPAAARQAEPPPPPPSTTALTDTSALGAPSTAPAQDAPLRDDLAPTPEPLRPREEPPTPAPAHEPRTHAPTPHAPSPTREPTLSATDAAAPVAEPNWNAAEQVAQHIERMVYERERNSLTVRLRPARTGRRRAAHPSHRRRGAGVADRRARPDPPDVAASPAVPARATRIARAAPDPLRCGRTEPISARAARATHTLRGANRIHTHPNGYGQPPARRTMERLGVNTTQMMEVGR
jgi:hypothetical protein